MASPIMTKPMRALERRAEAAESKAAAEATRADRAEIAAREMKVERDEWKRQAEHAVVELARLRAALAPAVAAMAGTKAPPQTAAAHHQVSNDTASYLEGIAAIAGFLKMKPRRVHHLIDSEGLPTFKLAGRICSRPATLNAWLASREAAGRGGR